MPHEVFFLTRAESVCRRRVAQGGRRATADQMGAPAGARSAPDDRAPTPVPRTQPGGVVEAVRAAERVPQGAIVGQPTDGGSLAAHASLVARECSIPAVVATGGATRHLRHVSMSPSMTAPASSWSAAAEAAANPAGFYCRRRHCTP